MAVLSARIRDGNTCKRRSLARAQFVPGMLACAVALGVAGPARGANWSLSLDLRALYSDASAPYRDGGLGKLRYDRHDSGLQLGRLAATWTQPIGEVFSAHADLSCWGGGDNNLLDLTEAYLEYRPYPRAGFRTRVRAGAFYPPMSLENRATGWETPYTLTPSAISSWIAEEVRTIGIEGQVDWLGTRMGHRFDLRLTGAVFGWNDPAGAVLANRGFALTDRQTPLFGRLGNGSEAAPRSEPFHEIDGRAGFYVGAEARYFDRATLDLIHYDNRGDPTAYSAALEDFAWQTRFDAAALRLESARGWTAIIQRLVGETYIAPRSRLLEWELASSSALVSKSRGPHRLSVRYDDFEVEHGAPGAPGNDSGHAWTVAYAFDPGASWRVTLEWLRARSNVPARLALLDQAPLQTESKVEVAFRYVVRSPQ